MRHMKNISRTHAERGAVSIFIVIFAALLMTIVTVGFVRIMVNDQSQATNSDLSQSAYDSALAGVEDAKRALLQYQTICAAGVSADCTDAAAEVSSLTCNNAVRWRNVVSSASEGTPTSDIGEISIQTTTGDRNLQQAYTCVTIDLTTKYYEREGNPVNTSTLVPLVSAPGDEFNTVTLEWFAREDLSSLGSGAVNLLGPVGAPKPLRAQASWPVDRPPLVGAQLMQYGANFSLTDFDSMSGAQSNANTVFLYPTSDVAANTTASLTARDPRSSGGGPTPIDQPTDTPLPVRCVASLSAGGYSCRIALQLPEPIGGTAADRHSYLRVTPFYNATSFRVSLSNGATPVDFSGVQPEVDSTGRANDVFRRVLSKVNMIDTSFPYPEGALDLTGNLCKDFAVTDTAYYAGTCTP